MKALVLLLFGLACLQRTNADQWEAPSVRGAISDDGDTVLRVVPAQRGAKATALVYRRSSADDVFRLERSFDLVNRVAPVHIAVSRGGEWFVTVDEWGSAGYSNAVVLYDQEGRHVRTWTVEELMSGDEISKLRVSVSSRDWASSLTIVDGYDGSIAFIYPPRDPKRGAPTRIVTIPLVKKK